MSILDKKPGFFFIHGQKYLLRRFPGLRCLPAARKQLSSCPPWKSIAVTKKNRPKSFSGKIFRAFWNRSSEICEIKKPVFSSKMFIGNCMKMKTFEIETIRFFSVSKIFERRFQVALTFLVFKKSWRFFLIYRCKIRLRRRWTRLGVLKM